MDIFRSRGSGLSAGRRLLSRAATTKIRAARHFLREVELLDMQPRRLASYGHY